MELEIIKKFTFSDDDLTNLFSVLLKLKKESSKPGFNKAIKLDAYEISFCNDVLEELMKYFGYEKEISKTPQGDKVGHLVHVNPHGN